MGVVPCCYRKELKGLTDEAVGIVVMFLQYVDQNWPLYFSLVLACPGSGVQCALTKTMNPVLAYGISKAIGVTWNLAEKAYSVVVPKHTAKLTLYAVLHELMHGFVAFRLDINDWEKHKEICRSCTKRFQESVGEGLVSRILQRRISKAYRQPLITRPLIWFYKKILPKDVEPVFETVFAEMLVWPLSWKLWDIPGYEHEEVRCLINKHFPMITEDRCPELYSFVDDIIRRYGLDPVTENDFEMMLSKPHLKRSYEALDKLARLNPRKKSCIQYYYRVKFG